MGCLAALCAWLSIPCCRDRTSRFRGVVTRLVPWGLPAAPAPTRQLSAFGQQLRVLASAGPLTCCTMVVWTGLTREAAAVAFPGQKGEVLASSGLTSTTWL